MSTPTPAPISVAAAQAREGARQADGQFGVQPRIEVSDVHLAEDFPTCGPSTAANDPIARAIDLTDDWADRVQTGDAVHAALVQTRGAGIPDERVRYLALQPYKYDYEGDGYIATILDDEGNELGESPVPGYEFRNGEDEVPEAFRVSTDDALVEFLSAYGQNENETSVIDVQKVLAYDWDTASEWQRAAIADAVAQPPITPEVAFKANRKALVDAVADYDNDPSVTSLTNIQMAAVAMESTLSADEKVQGALRDELRQARQRAVNTPNGMRRLRRAIDDVSGWGEAVYGV